MGALLARSLVEDDASRARDVCSLILIAPVNQGSHLAKVQTVMQFMNGLQAINGKNTTKAMMNLSDGLGQAAEDMLPGSAFLKGLESPAASAGTSLPHPGRRPRLPDPRGREPRSRAGSIS